MSETVQHGDIMLSKANSELYAVCRVVLFHWLWVTPNYHYPKPPNFYILRLLSCPRYLR